MPLDRRRLGGQVSDDDQHSLDDNDQIYNAITMGLIAVAGIGLYRTGALKGIISPLLEVADNIAGKSVDKAGVSMSVIKKWAGLPHLTATQASLFKEKPWSAPKKSLFRLGRETDDGVLNSILKDLKSAVNGEGASFHNIKQYINGTVEDVNILKSMLNEESANIVKKKEAYTNTSLYRKLMNFREFSTVVSANMHDQEAKTLRSKFLEELADTMTQDESLSSKAFKRTGYRKITLGDIAELDDTGRALRMKENAPVNISGDLLDKFNRFASETWNQRYHGKGLLSTDAWKNITIDSGIRINEAGHVIDYRMTRDMKNGFLRSLSTDFGIPGAKFNPFKSIFGLDHAGEEEIFGAYIAGTQIDPSITGRAGRYTINEYLNDTFGADFFKSGRDSLDKEYGFAKGMAVINGKAYIVGGDKARGTYTDLVQIGEGFKLHDITNADIKLSLTRSINAERQMAGLDIGTDPETGKTWKERLTGMAPKEMFDYLEENGVHVTPFMKAKYRIARWLDMGSQEVRMDRTESGSFVENFTIDGLIEKWSNKLANAKAMQMSGWQFGTASDIMGQFNGELDEVASQSIINKFNYKSVFGAGPDAIKTSNMTINPHMYYAQRQHYSAKNIKNAILGGDWGEIKETSKRFFGQYFAGRELGNDKYMSKLFTESSGGAFAPWTYLNALNEGIGSMSYQLGLSTEAKKNVGSLMSGLLLKRVLPIYMLTQVPGVINYLSEPFFDKDEKTGQNDNLTRWLMRGPVKSMDVFSHKAMDTVGFTNIFKKAQTFVPGSDQINELPFIYQLGLGQTEEERKDYIENGYDPIRKGRYWSLGNTPFTGTKILYWRPNLYRRVQADVMFSDSKWGSRQEYYNNTWFPNPVNPLAPVNHFLLDRNHYDYKHYLDRPYLKTAPVGQNIPIVGPLFSSTVGSIGQRKMHKEYWENGLEPLPGDELPAPAITTGQVFRPAMAPLISPYSDTDMRIANQRIAMAQQADAESRYASSFIANESMRRSIRDTSGIEFFTRPIIPRSNIDFSGIIPTSSSYDGTPRLPVRNYDRYDGNPYEIYVTPSGRSSIVDVPDEMNLYNVNQDLRKWSINKIPGTDKRVTLVDRWTGPDVGPDYTADNDFYSIGLQQQFNTLTDVAGLKGFALRQFGTGEMGRDSRIVDTSAHAYGMNKSFWDQNLGGLGGNLSEITRRFVPDRNNNMEYINPIRNTMPNWMPGSDYFTDFKHGDPYAKIMNGEERLPGEGYERMYGLTHVADMNIGSSYLGYSRADIIKHLIGQDDYISSFEEDTLNKGTKIHKQIEREWMDSGFAMSTEGEIKDKRNGILGYYDAMVHDETSPTGIGIVDIKTTSKKKLAEIRKAGAPLEHHQKQVNYYLWATNNTQSKGYIYYVDKEDLSNAYMVGFNYDQSLLEDSFKNLYGAREDIKLAMEKGIIGRGDLYKPLDRFRILADVAPYSQEFNDAAAALSREKLSPEEQREATAIRERMKEQKEPLRVYPYKFKTANLKTETVTVKEILDNNTIVTEEYGRQHAIKFAGINVSNSMNELVDTHKEKYTDKRGTVRYRTVGTPKAEAARNEIASRIGIGGKITISYDADERNKYSKDSTKSIRAVIRGKHGENINKILLEKGLANEKENDDSPAGIHARYTEGEIRFGSAMERVTHGVISHIPFIGSKTLQVQSPYEAYRRKEVYGKDFQSWNNPISGILVPNIQRDIGEVGGIAGIAIGAFVGSLFGRGTFGKLVGATIGGTTVAIGKGYAALDSTSDRAWRPERREKQEALNEYVDTLKYVKNMRLYEQYKQKAKAEDHFDVDLFENTSEAKGISNKLRQQELTNYKKLVKMDFKNRDEFSFRYGQPKYVENGMNYKETISAINKELSELQSERKVVKAPLNAMKALSFKQQADATMYGYEPGDSLVNIMTALPKKERQYFKHFMNAPEEEKGKILKIAPSYLRRALQSTWGMQVDEKPDLDEYFMRHGLPDENWIGWDESVDMTDVKVKIVHKEKMDPGEFDIWRDTKKQADMVNIPIPNMHATNSRARAQMQLYRLLGKSGMQDIQMRHMSSDNPNADVTVSYDGREDVIPLFKNISSF